MDLEFTADQDELRNGVRQFLAAEVPMSLVRAVVEQGVSTDALWKSMADLDWPALTVPEDCGGMGLGFVELAVVAEELGRATCPGPYLATVAQFGPMVRELGTPEQRRRFLGPLAAGEVTGTVAVAEASGSWQVADVTATVVPDGDGWVLHGTKCYVQDGASVDELAVVARRPGTTGADGVTVVVVPRTAVRTERRPVLDASRELATVHLDGARVDADRVLGSPGSAARGAERALHEATAALALEMVGTCQTLLDVTLEYAKARRQFDVPIGSFQALKHRFADLYVALERARACCYFATATIAEDDERRDLAVAIAKAAAGDAARLSAKEGIQIHGGIGFTWEHDMHLWVKRLKTSEVTFGTTASHRLRVAELIGV